MPEKPTQHILPAGYRLDEYEIIRELGSGGFGITYIAWDKHVEREVVIKENLPVFAYRDGATATVLPRNPNGEDAELFAWSLTNFIQEARTLGKFDHPNIVRVLRVIEANGTAYFVMPFVPGQALSQLFQQRYDAGEALGEDELRAIILPLLDALEQLHAQRVFHRDIKPANILIQSDGRPVLIDFGAARQRISQKSLTVVESPGYTPFEQLESRGNVGPWSDLYGLAATLYKGITGESPPKAADRIKRDPIRCLAREYAGRYSTALLELLDAALQFDETARPQSVDAWRLALRAVEQPTESRPPQATVQPDPATQWRSREATVLPSVPPPPPRSSKLPAIMVLLALGIAAWAVLSRPAERAREVVKIERIPVAPDFQQAPQPIPRPEPTRSKVEPAPLPEPVKPKVEPTPPSEPVKPKVEPAPLPDMVPDSKKVDPAEIYFKAYLLCREAELLAKNSQLPEALAKFREAQALFDSIANQFPTWQTEMLSLRRKKVVDAITDVEAHMEGSGKAMPFVNSLGMKFVPVPINAGPSRNKKVLFCIWETRRQDYAAYAAKNSAVDDSWKAQEFIGVPIGQKDAEPVVNVSWEDATAFCAWLTKTERAAGRIVASDEYRLPTDVEWSYAVGIGDKEDAGVTPEAKGAKIIDVYPWGKSFPPPVNSGNYADSSTTAKFGSGCNVIEGYKDGYPTTALVGSFEANSYGIYDLGGNVWEWCIDWYNTVQQHRVLRGASWFDYHTSSMLSSCRYISAPDNRQNFVGFRIVLVVRGGG